MFFAELYLHQMRARLAQDTGEGVIVTLTGKHGTLFSLDIWALVFNVTQSSSLVLPFTTDLKLEVDGIEVPHPEWMDDL